MNFKPDTFIKASQEGILDRTIDLFLRGEGKNVAMADGLKLAKRYWIGPVQFPINSLKRICGPEEGMLYKESVENWELRINNIADYVTQGGELPPFIVQYTNGHIVLSDGNHRLGSLEKLGMHRYWTLIWCDTEDEIQEVKDKYGI